MSQLYCLLLTILTNDELLRSQLTFFFLALKRCKNVSKLLIFNRFFEEIKKNQKGTRSEEYEKFNFIGFEPLLIEYYQFYNNFM